MHLLSRLFAKEITLKCRNSDTLILCPCHFKPMIFKREDVEKAIKSGHKPQCDVCAHIDLAWATEMGKLVDDYKLAIDDSDLMLKLLKDGKEAIPAFPDLPGVVAEAIKSVISDFNKNPAKYQSICERKLQIAKERKHVAAV